MFRSFSQAELARGPQVTLGYAFMEDPSDASSPSKTGGALDSVPSALMALPAPGTLSHIRGECYIDGLLQGSSETPIGYFACTMGRHSLYILFNPLDALLRPMLEAQRDARCARFTVIDHAQNAVRSASRVPAHELALRATAGRPAVDGQTWLSRAQDHATFMPHVGKMGEPALGRSKWHHVYFLMPNAEHVLANVQPMGSA